MTAEFAIYETIMMYLAGAKKESNVLNNDHEFHIHDGIFEHAEDKNPFHILFASASAGALGGLLTNPFEYLVVNKQANPKMTITNVFKTTKMYDIFFRGGSFRTLYYSYQAVLIFFLLEKIGVHLDCEL
jgi:hypothetical protein